MGGSFIYMHDGSYPPQFKVEPLPLGVYVICDLDQDGDSDLVGRTRRWLESSGGANPVFVQRTQPELSSPTVWDYAMDFDGDGDLDFAGLSRLPDGTVDFNYVLTWSENLGGSPLRFRSNFIFEERLYQRHGISIKAADLDQDGLGEIIVWRYDITPRTTWSGSIGIYSNLTRYVANAIPAAHWQLFP